MGIWVSARSYRCFLKANSHGVCSTVTENIARDCGTRHIPIFLLISGVMPPTFSNRSAIRSKLLNNSFQPPAEIRVLRTYWRQRGEHVRGAATCVQRMQKALTQMNVQLANVISDVSGLTGQTIVR